MISIPLVLSEKHPCSYLDDEDAQSVFVHPSFGLSTAMYSELIQQGFRRSGDNVYSPYCQSCSACIPARVKVDEFVPGRSQRRCWQKNANTQVVIKSAQFEQAHYDMYLRYQSARHQDGEMLHSSKEDYSHFLGSSWCNTVFVEFSIAGELAAVAVVDQLDNALSAVYTFFEPKFSSFGLGVYAVLWQIHWAEQCQKEYLYLGFWIKACKKMSYKDEYKPLQILKDKCWL